VLNRHPTPLLFNADMRYAADDTRNANYCELVDSCRHSRLRAALSCQLPSAPARRYVAVAPSAATLVVSDTTRAYLWVACMSVLSLLSVIVTGTINA
jgi:hypothetical protein